MGALHALHNQNLQLGASSCVSTRRSHIHINGLFVLRVFRRSPQTGMFERRAVAVGRGPSAAVPAKEEHRQGPHTGAKQVTKFKRIAGKKGAIWEWLQNTDHNGTDHTANPLALTQIQPHDRTSRRYSQLNALVLQLKMEIYIIIMNMTVPV